MQPHASQPATPCVPGCNPTHPRLQPRLQPHAPQAALLGLLRLRDAAQQSAIAQQLLSQVAAPCPYPYPYP
eukprot:scaffold100780_cov33-Phaeocystis_antarctica.AAC.2